MSIRSILLLLWPAARAMGAAVSSTSTSSAAASPTPAPAAPVCQSFGIDFKDGGAYFQNVSSHDPFTFVSTFQGCQNATADNLLVDPKGMEIMCSGTSLVPDNVNMLSTCPITKDQLASGAWSVLIISNNGNGTPIAYERDFILTVGVPVTSTYTPTITITATTSAISSTTVTTTATDDKTTTSTSTTTITAPGVTNTATFTTTPTTTLTETITTVGISETCNLVFPTYAWFTHVASCSVPPRQWTADPHAIFTPTLVTAAALQTAGAQAPLRRRGVYKILHGLDSNVPVMRDEHLEQRKARLASMRPYHTEVLRRGLRKRAPDSATTTVTETNTALYPVTTSLYYTTTNTFTFTESTRITVTETRTIVVAGPTSQAPTVTETAGTVTTTKTVTVIVATTVSTRSHYPTVSMTSISLPTPIWKTCVASGGVMI